MTGSRFHADPTVTIVMPVYNALPYLDEAVASIVGQTHSNLRLAIYDDHSNDGSYEAAMAWTQRDSRVSVTRGAQRLGPCGSSNAAAALADTELVARMDADDVMVPERLEVQLAALAEHPRSVLVGSIFDVVDANGNLVLKSNPGQIEGERPPIAHSSILYRRATLQAIGGYRENTDYFEDLDLYRRISSLGEILVINRPLIKVRFSGQNARLRDDQLDVLTRINRLYSPGGRSGVSRRDLSPVAFYSIANLAVMGSSRPRMLRLFARKVGLERPLLAAAVAVFIAIAEISPSLARMGWRLATAMRDWLHPKSNNPADHYLWAPHSGVAKVEKVEAAPAKVAGAA